MNFISTFDELNKLYEEVQEEKVEEACKEELTEAAEDEIVEDEIPAEEVPAEEPAEEPTVDEEPRQVICECDKCGALVIKDEADIVVDEETDLVNVEDECQFCDEAKGYKIIGVVAPYEVAEDLIEEPIEEAFEAFKGPVEWSKLKKNHTLEVVDITDFKKGDLLVEIKPENINKIADDDTACYVYKVSNDGGQIELHLGGSQGSNLGRPGKKFVRAVKSKGKQVEEDLADLYRKVFDKPASTDTQQAWEDELNGEMGEISDKRRKQLEKKFARQRDWEARHPEAEVE